jgi:hypothetical protein
MYISLMLTHVYFSYLFLSFSFYLSISLFFSLSYTLFLSLVPSPSLLLSPFLFYNLRSNHIYLIACFSLDRAAARPS